MLETQEHIELNSSTIERGYKSCKGAVKKFFKGSLWSASNVPSEQRRSLDAIMFNLMRTIDLLDLESVDGLSLDVWHEIQNDLSDAFRDRCSSVELAALVDTARKYDVPKQFLFDPLRGADHWIRSHKFDCFDQLESFCSYIGGSALASSIPVLGAVKPGYEVAAIECGKAIMLTQILANCVRDMKQNKVFFAAEDIEDCEVDLPRLRLRRASQGFRHLVRLYVHRIEKMFVAGGPLLSHMDYDGKRTLKSLMGANWKMLMKMKVDPECILSEEGVLTKGEMLGLKSRHLLGMESELPFVTDPGGHHH
ncbi:MAG: squalene/phytoene synthase family protein [Mariniblastus sp.]